MSQEDVDREETLVDLTGELVALRELIQVWNEHRENITEENLDHIQNVIMYIIGLPLIRMEFKFFKNILLPTIKEINKNPQLVKFLTQFRTELRSTGSSTDNKAFFRYFSGIKHG